jgi:hypothetical protein
MTMYFCLFISISFPPYLEELLVDPELLLKVVQLIPQVLSLCAFLLGEPLIVGGELIQAVLMVPEPLLQPRALTLPLLLQLPLLLRQTRVLR